VSFDVDSVDGTASVRAYTFVNQTDRVLVTGAAWDVDTGSQSGTVDAAAFGMQSGSGGDGVGFYFGTLSASGTYSLSATSIATSYSGSLSEMAVNFQGLAPYINKDGNAGFQYLVDKDHFSCLEDGADCLPDYSSSLLDFSEIGWSPISITKADCSADPNAVTTNECAVYKFSTSTTGTASVRFDMYITTQPVNLDGGVTVTPDDLKLDLTYTFPASNYPAACSGNCGVAVVAIAGGKATSGSGDGVVQYNGDGSADGHSTFQTDSGKAAYFSWTSAVTVGGTASTMYSSIVTGSDVSDLSNNCLTDGLYALDHLVACLVGSSWNTIYVAYDAFGWQLRLYFFSTPETNPGTVVWDPQIGGADCDADASNPVCSSGASSLLPLLALLLLQ
jgi:hypothetical protein